MIMAGTEKQEVLLIGLCVRACGHLGAWACAYVYVALLIQHATHMHHTVMSFVAHQSLPHFSTLSHKWCNFQKQVIKHKMCFDFLYNFQQNISHSKKNLTRYPKRRNVFM